MKQRLIVIGGGASGFFTAINAAEQAGPDLEVIILEKTEKVLQKVSISGGGRCNVTHACFDIPALASKYPRGAALVKKAFHHFGPSDTIEWFAARGVALKTEEDGRMFPVSDQSATIIRCFMQEVNRLGIQLRFKQTICSIEADGQRWKITNQHGETILADYVVVASGGAPKMSQLQFLQALPLSFEEPVPSLFTFNLPKHPITSLMGVAVPKASVKIEGEKLQTDGPLLVTHWGLSGPAILKASAIGARWMARQNYQFAVLVNWTGIAAEEVKHALESVKLQHPKAQIGTKSMFQIPIRLWQFLIEQVGIDRSLRWCDLSNKFSNALHAQLVCSRFEVAGKTTFKEEFVTAGGVSLANIKAQTMEAKSLPGLYFVGEVLDVDGITGGFNFQHAWTSGWLAAKHIAENSKTAKEISH